MWTREGACPRGRPCISTRRTPSLPYVSTSTHTKLAHAPTLRRRRVARSYAALRKNDKIMAFLDNPKAATPDSEGEDDEEEKPKARVFKASQQASGTAAWTHGGGSLLYTGPPPL